MRWKTTTVTALRSSPLDKWGALHEAHGTAIILRQVKYLNNIAEQDHRSMKQVTRLLSEFKSFEASQGTLVGIELRHTLTKG